MKKFYKQLTVNYLLIPGTWTRPKVNTERSQMNNTQVYDTVNESVYQVYSKFRIQNSEFRIRNSEFRIRNSEFRTRNSEFGIQNSEFGIQNSELLLTFKSYPQWCIGPILQCNSYVHIKYSK